MRLRRIGTSVTILFAAAMLVTAAFVPAGRRGRRPDGDVRGIRATFHDRRPAGHAVLHGERRRCGDIRGTDPVDRRQHRREKHRVRHALRRHHGGREPEQIRGRVDAGGRRHRHARHGRPAIRPRGRETTTCCRTRRRPRRCTKRTSGPIDSRAPRGTGDIMDQPIRNSYQLFSAGGMNLIVLNLQLSPNQRHRQLGERDPSFVPGPAGHRRHPLLPPVQPSGPGTGSPITYGSMGDPRTDVETSSSIQTATWSWS